MNKLLFVFILMCVVDVKAQYAPAAGQPGTTAIANDSSAIVRWANDVVLFDRGAADIANGWATLASYGDESAALGYAQGDGSSVVSLGDSGSITLAFPFPVMNGPGNDFAVFENGFNDTYLELAVVEVSSDGSHFVRFPAVSLTQEATQTSSFGSTNPEEIHNLAGKYRQGYGTPFDLDDLIDSSGINLDSVRFVRIIDVIGTINTAYCMYDSQGNRINDPYPTDFASGGFDLDGVGVINENNIYAALEEQEKSKVIVYPNPSNGVVFIQSDEPFFDLKIVDLAGKIVFSEAMVSSGSFDFSTVLEKGIYLLYVNDEARRMIVF